MWPLADFKDAAVRGGLLDAQRVFLDRTWVVRGPADQVHLVRERRALQLAAGACCACVAEGLPGGCRAGERRSSCVHAALPAGDMRCQFLCPSTLAHREHARAKEYAPHHLQRQLGGAAPSSHATREQLCFPGGDGA